MQCRGCVCATSVSRPRPGAHAFDGFDAGAGSTRGLSAPKATAAAFPGAPTLLTLGSEALDDAGPGLVRREAAFVLPPSTLRVSHMPMIVCRALSSRIIQPLVTSAPRFSLCRGLSLRSRFCCDVLRRPPGGAPERLPLSMRVEQEPPPDGVKLLKDRVAAPTDGHLRDFWDSSCDLLRALSDVVESEAVLIDAVSGHANWGQCVNDNNLLSGDLAWWLKIVEAEVTSLPGRCAEGVAPVSQAIVLLRAFQSILKTMVRSLGVARGRATSTLRESSTHPELRKRLLDVRGFFSSCINDVELLGPSVNRTIEQLVALFNKNFPVVASLRPDWRLPAGSHRSPGSVLALVPARDEACRIRRDAEVVQVLTHLYDVAPKRVASVVASSPGTGKSHLVWDLEEALQFLDDPRLAAASTRVGQSSWQDVVEKLREWRVCVITFNSSSEWGSLDKLMMQTFAADPQAIFLPFCLRVLWYLRCGDAVTWNQFVPVVAERLENGPATVGAVISEAQAALREQPTVVVVEELSKVTGYCMETPGASPADSLWSPLDSTGEVAVPVQQPLLDVYRHEVCAMAGMSEKTVVLFTSPSFGLIYAEVKGYLTGAQQTAYGAELAGMASSGIRAEEENTRLSSPFSNRPFSSFFVLSAVELGFLDLDDLAETYFLPLFDDRFAIRMSLPYQGSHMLSSALSARAMSRLSGGHPRSAAFLRQVLQRAPPGPVWSSVVEPAVGRLVQVDALTTTVNVMLDVPVIIIAAVHPCTVQSQLPILTGTRVSDPCATWDDLLASNTLTAAVKDDAGSLENMCMPPLYLLALLKRWMETKSGMRVRSASKELFCELNGILEALQQVCGASVTKGSADKVWEYVTMFADVALTRVRAAGLSWCTASPSISLPFDYTKVTLRQLYPGTLAYYIDGERPLLESMLYNATKSVIVNEEEANNSMRSVLQRPVAELLSTMYKCQPQQCGFDSIKFLPPAGCSEQRSRDELVAVCKSSKFTGHASVLLNLEEHVRKGLTKLKKAFGSKWEEWSDRVVLVVETNHPRADTPEKLLSVEESAKVIIITVDDHLAVYGRAISGFMADGPSLYGATLEVVE